MAYLQSISAGVLDYLSRISVSSTPYFKQLLSMYRHTMSTRGQIACLFKAHPRDEFGKGRQSKKFSVQCIRSGRDSLVLQGS